MKGGVVVRDFPLLYEADAAAFLERSRRAASLLAILSTPGKSFDVDGWSRDFADVMNEVDELPLVVGVRYRVKTLGGNLEIAHREYRSEETGEKVTVHLPTMVDPEYVELEGIFRGRQRTPHGTSNIVFDMGGEAALLSDSDVLRLEEMRP